MVYRKGIIHCACANVIYPAQEIHWYKCNLTCFSTNFRFEDFSWMLPRAAEYAVACHTRSARL